MSHRAGAPRLLINARMVKEKDRARARELRRLLFCGAAILVPLLVYVWQRVDFLRVSYRVEALKKDYFRRCPVYNLFKASGCKMTDIWRVNE